MRHLIIVFTLLGLYCHPAWSQGESCGSLFRDQKGAADTIESSLIKVRDSLKQLKKDIKEFDGREDQALNAALKNLPEDPRELSYLLQGAYRLLTANPRSTEVMGHKTTRQMFSGLEKMKRLEKILGTYQNARDLVKSAEKMDAPADFIRHLKKQRQTVARKTIKILKEEDFFKKDDSVLDEMIERVARIRKVEEEAGGNFITDALRAELSRVQEKVNQEMRPLILKDRYTHHELEFGAHALRRSLRWIKVYALAYRDYFKAELPNRPLTPAELSLIERYQGKEELQFNPLGEKSINQLEFLLLNDLIAELRKVKGVGETRENLTVQLRKSGEWNGRKISAEEAEGLIQMQMKDTFEGIEKRTQALLKIYESTNGFKNLIPEGQ